METDNKPKNNTWNDETAFDLVRKPKDQLSSHQDAQEEENLQQTMVQTTGQHPPRQHVDAVDGGTDHEDNEPEGVPEDETTDAVIISSVSQPVSSKQAPSDPGPQDPTDPFKESERESKSTRNFLIAIAMLLLLLTAVFATRFLFGEQNVTGHAVTIDELHQQNVAGKLKPSAGYMYNGFSFVKFNDVWNTQLAKGNTVYDLTFNNDPKSVENISVSGKLNPDYFNDKTIFITFDPLGNDLKHVAVANFGFSRSLSMAFDYNLSAGCTREENCAGYPIYTCDDKDKSVVYFKEANETAVIYENNCVIVQGKESEIVRAKDRLLMRWYGILNQ